MTHQERAMKLAEALLDRVKSNTALLPGTLEKWGSLIADEIAEAIKYPQEGWVKTTFFLETCAELQAERDALKAQLRTAQEVINLHATDGIEGLHCVDCVAEPDEICDCPMVVPFFVAMKGYEDRVDGVNEHTPSSGQRDRDQPGGTPPGPSPTDTCENYRDGGGIKSRYCSAFEANAEMHALTCQFHKSTEVRKGEA